MRSCAKNGCDDRARATAMLRYGAREVVISDLERDGDPNLIDLCLAHADRLSPPIGWRVTDLRDAGLEAAPG